jgi:hypothetical protein
VLFGGQTDTSGTPIGDTWTFDGATWTEITGAGPSARYAPAMATLGNVVVMFGGTSGTLETDTWLFDGTKWALSPATGPTGRIGHAMTTLGSTVLLYGGGGTGETWSFDGSKWTELSTLAAPGVRTDHAMATLP